MGIQVSLSGSATLNFPRSALFCACSFVIEEMALMGKGLHFLSVTLRMKLGQQWPKQSSTIKEHLSIISTKVGREVGIHSWN